MKNNICYIVKDWVKNFEGAKSKTYKNKSSCQMPTKHGLGYKRLVRMKNGPAIFGAWCAMIQVLSRHDYRQGYCTDTGRMPRGYHAELDGNGQNNGIPYTSDDIAILIDMPSDIVEQMLLACASEDVGWLEVIDYTDATRIPHGCHTDTTGPLDSDSYLDLHSDSHSDSRGRECEVGGNQFGKYGDYCKMIISCRNEFRSISGGDIAKELSACSEDKLDQVVGEFVRSAANMIKTPDSPIGMLRGFVYRAMVKNEGSKRQTKERERLI